MTAREDRRIPEPRVVDGPEGPWEPIGEDLDRHGVSIVYSPALQWRDVGLAGAELHEFLGRDLPKYETMRPGALRDRFVTGRVLLKHVTAAAVGIAPAEIELGYSLTGKLYVRGLDQVHLSFSHSGDALLAGVSSLGAIGVDVERRDRSMAIAPHLMCTAREQAGLERESSTERQDLMLRLWTLKEAYSKAIGQGLRFPFTKFGFELGDGTARLHRADGTSIDDQVWRFRTLIVGAGGYAAAIALHDVRGGRIADTRAQTALDQEMVSTVRRLLAADDDS